MAEIDVDVLVVGAGPAGVAAGITARAQGLSVLVVDRAPVGRDKTCGDGLTTAALRHLEALGFPLPAIGSAGSPVATAVLRSPSGRVVELALPAGRGHRAVVVARADLDAALVAHARRVGVTVRDRTALGGLTAVPGTGALDASLGDDTNVRAAWVIAADGHFSPTRKLVSPDLPPSIGEWSAFRQYFGGVDDRRLWVLFEEDLLPGYAWVFPLPGRRANVGFGVLRGRGAGGGGDGHRIKGLWQDLLARPALRAVLGPDAEPEATHRAWPIPTAYDPDRLATGRVLFVGDAASVVDPLTGEGIAQALETGVLAADAIARGGDVAARYRRTVDRALGRDLRFATRLQRVLAHPRGARSALRAVDLSAWTRRNFARWMFEDYPRALLLTPDRWTRGRVGAGGAYVGVELSPEAAGSAPPDRPARRAP